jgi:hypothetical protein
MYLSDLRSISEGEKYFILNSLSFEGNASVILVCERAQSKISNLEKSTLHVLQGVVDFFGAGVMRNHLPDHPSTKTTRTAQRLHTITSVVDSQGVLRVLVCVSIEIKL